MVLLNWVPQESEPVEPAKKKGRPVGSKNKPKGVTAIVENKTTNKKVTQHLLDKGWRQQPRNAKCRYLYLIAQGEERQRIYNRIKQYISDYPKRPNSAPVVK